MKRPLSFVLIVLMLASLACQASLTTSTPPPRPSVTSTVTLTLIPTQTETPTITPTPPLTTSSGPALLELHMFSATHGWGLTEDQILITRDAGISWAQVPLPGATVNSSVSAYFISQELAYFFAPIAGAKIGQLFATRDGGATWVITPTPFANAKLYFVNDNVGFALQTLNIVNTVMAVDIYQTLDRGATWTQVFTHITNPGDTNLPQEGLKTGISFIDPSRGFISLYGQNNSIGLYHAQDAGRNWSKQDLPLPDGLGSLYRDTVWPPFFFQGNDHDGFLSVDFSTNASGPFTRVFYITHDSGATWEKGGEIPNGSAYFFLDLQNGWAWGEHSIYATSDGAKTWNQMPVAFGRSERASIIDFFDLQNGWLVTIDAKNVLRMYRTTDGGGTWTAIIA